MHNEVKFAEFTAASVRALDPLLKAGLVHIAQGAGAVAGGDEGKVWFSLTVADTTHILQAVSEARGHSRWLR